MKIFNSFHLKISAILFMVFDHLAYFLPDLFPLWFRYPGRLAAPIFFFIAVQGFLHTKSVKRYLIRLFVAAGLMDLGSFSIFSLLSSSVEDKIFYPIYLNIFLTIALGVTFLAIYEWSIRQQNIMKILLAIFSIFFVITLFDFVEYGYISLFLFLIFYFGRHSKALLSTFFILFSLSLFIFSNIEISFILTPKIDSQWFMVFSLPFFILYNNKKGTDFKYFFYFFYPIHIWVLYIISVAF